MIDWDAMRERAKEQYADATECQWFPACTRPIAGTHHHPALGEVPTCKVCLAWLENLDKQRSNTP